LAGRHDPVVVAPLRRVADLVYDLRELGLCLLAGRVVHPGQAVEIRLHRTLDVADHLLGCALAVLAEVLLHEGLRERLTEESVSERDAPLPPRLQDLRAR